MMPCSTRRAVFRRQAPSTVDRAADASIAIVGDGIAALICFAMLRQHGWPASALTVYGDNPHPLARLERSMRALGQREMRSESAGHVRPVEFPGLATIDAWERRSLLPLLAILIDAYRPSVDLFVADTTAIPAWAELLQQKVARRVARIVRAPHDEDLFVLSDAQDRVLGQARHVILALGQPGLAWPAAVQPWRTSQQISHAYQQSAPPQAGERIVVIGGGMAAVHTWIAALQAGATVTALHRRPLRRQPLNAPRCRFGTAEIEAYRRLTLAQRRAFHAERASSFPWRWRWEWQLWRSRRQGLFVDMPGELAAIEVGAGRAGAALRLRLEDERSLVCDRLICATGFEQHACAHELIAQLVAAYDLPLVDGMLSLTDDLQIPKLSRSDSTCTVVGALARWALPVADTFVGMKYAARRLTATLSRHAA